MKNIRHIYVIVLLLYFAFVIGCSHGRSLQKEAGKLYEEGQHLTIKRNISLAMEKFKASLSLSRQAGYQVGVAHNLNEMAIIYTSQGMYDQARRCLIESILIYKTLDMPPEVSKAMNNMALTYLQEGNYEDAIKHYEDLIEWDRKTNNPLGEGITLHNIGRIYDIIGSHEEAQKKYQEALKILEASGNHKYLPMIQKYIKPD